MLAFLVVFSGLQMLSRVKTAWPFRHPGPVLWREQLDSGPEYHHVHQRANELRVFRVCHMNRLRNVTSNCWTTQQKSLTTKESVTPSPITMACISHSCDSLLPVGQWPACEPHLHGKKSNCLLPWFHDCHWLYTLSSPLAVASVLCNCSL